MYIDLGIYLNINYHNNYLHISWTSNSLKCSTAQSINKLTVICCCIILYHFYHAYAELANQNADSQVDKATYHTRYDTCLLVTMPLVQENVIIQIRSTVKPLTPGTPEIRTPLKSGHLVLPQIHTNVYKSTPEIRKPLKSGHLLWSQWCLGSTVLRLLASNCSAFKEITAGSYLHMHAHTYTHTQEVVHIITAVTTCLLKFLMPVGRSQLYNSVQLL